MAIPAAVFVYILSQNDLFWDKLCLMGRLISCSTLFWIYLPTLGGKILSQTESPAAVFNSTNISGFSIRKLFWHCFNYALRSGVAIMRKRFCMQILTSVVVLFYVYLAYAILTSRSFLSRAYFWYTKKIHRNEALMTL